jgi:hypothetical protein
MSILAVYCKLALFCQETANPDYPGDQNADLWALEMRQRQPNLDVGQVPDTC